jgi:ABC-type glycerol-3-phosphate transport system substrate-binding protein
MRKVVIFVLLTVVLLSACSGTASEQQGSEDEQPISVTVYRSPT